MLDLSWGEIMLIGAVALIVIGPKDLPRTLRAVGQTIGKVRRMAGEFQGHFNQAMREAELDEVRKEVEGMNRMANTAFNPAKAVRDELKNTITGQHAANKPAVPPASSTPASTTPEAAAAPSAAADAPPVSGPAAPAPTAPASPAPEPVRVETPVASAIVKDEAKP